MSVSGVSSTCGAQGVGESRPMRGPRQLPDEAISALAEKLGVSADELKTKLESADDPREVLDHLAEEKGITKQELRETMRAAMPAQTGPAGPPPPPGAGPAGISFDDEVGQKLLSALAEKLGTSTEGLQSKLEDGANLRDLLEEGGVTHEDVRAAFAEAFKSWQSYGASGSTTGSYAPEYNAVDIQV